MKTYSYAATVSRVNLPMLAFWIERDLLDLAFEEMLSTAYDKDMIDGILSDSDEDLPAVDVGEIPTFATWYLSSDDWRGYGVLKVDPNYEWSVDIFQLDELPASETLRGDGRHWLVGQIKLSQRRLGEVRVSFWECHPDLFWESRSPLFCDDLIDWLWDEYECEVDDAPDPFGGPLSWAEYVDAPEPDDEPIAANPLQLTQTEIEIAHAAARYMPYAEIARARVIATRTVTNHIKNIGDKLRVAQAIPEGYRFKRNEIKKLLRQLGY